MECRKKKLPGFRFGFRHHKTARFIIPCRNSLSPPKLAADAPVFDVLHPVPVKVFEFGRIEFDLVVGHGFQCVPRPFWEIPRCACILPMNAMRILKGNFVLSR